MKKICKNFSMSFMVILFAVTLTTSHAQPKYAHWLQTIGGATSLDWMAGLVLDHANNLYGVGTSFSEGFDDTDLYIGDTVFNFKTPFENFYLVKFTSTGKFLWAKNFFCPDPSYRPTINEMGLDSKDNLYLTGTFASDVNMGGDTILRHKGSYPGTFVIMYNSEGVLQWLKTFIPQNATPDEGFIVMATTMDNHDQIYLTGDFRGTMNFDNGTSISSRTGKPDGFLIKLETSGKVQWAKAYKGEPDGRVSPYEIATDNNLVYLGGSFSKTVKFDDSTIFSDQKGESFTARISPSGNLIGIRTLGGDLLPDNQQNLYLTGSLSDTLQIDDTVLIGRRSPDGYRALDFFVVKFDSTDHLIWAKKFSTDSSAEGRVVLIAGDTNLLLHGGFVGTVLLDSLELQSKDRDVYMATLSPSGKITEAKNFGGEGDQFAGLYPVSPGDIYLSGAFLSTIDLYNLHATKRGGTADGFIAKISDTPTGVDEFNKGPEDAAISVYPNPTHGSFIVTLQENHYKQANFILYDMLGRTLRNVPVRQLDTRSYEITLENAPKGIYFLSLEADQVKVVKKMLVY